MDIQRVARLTIRFIVAVSILVPASGAWAGGIVDEDLKSAVKFEERAEFQRAAEAYARVLRLEPGNKKARSGFSRVAGRAIAEKIALARKYEESQRYTDAQVELNAAIALEDRVRSVGITLDSGIDAAAASAAMIDRWVGHLYGEAMQAQTDELWSAAVAHLRKIETLRPAYKDVRNRLIEVWTAWGNQELDLRMYRSAAERFIEASRVPGVNGSSAARKAAAILGNLGTHALDKGACRSAVRDLRSANAAAPDAILADALMKAESCALTCLSLAVGSDRELEMEISRLERVGTEIRSLIVDRGSSFLTVSQHGSAERGLCDSKRLTGASPQWTPRRIRATVDVTSQIMLRSPATSRNSEFRSSQMIGGQIVGESVAVIRVYDEVFSGSMTGTITLADQRTGRNSPAIPVRVEGETSAQWVKGTGAVVSTGTATRSTRIGDGPGLDRLARIEDQRLEARSRLKDSLTRDFVVETARIILEMVDDEPGISDPVSIDISLIPAPGG